VNAPIPNNKHFTRDRDKHKTKQERRKHMGMALESTGDRG
jgi:hypothetical protein